MPIPQPQRPHGDFPQTAAAGWPPAEVNGEAHGARAQNSKYKQ